MSLRAGWIMKVYVYVINSERIPHVDSLTPSKPLLKLNLSHNEISLIIWHLDIKIRILVPDHSALT